MGTPHVTVAEGTILAALSAEELYGLEIIHEVNNRGGAISLGGLYTLLHRLEKKGLIKGRWADDSESRAGARRRYYRMSALGGRALANLRRAVAMPTGRFALEGGSTR